MTISQNRFLEQVALHLDLPLDHPLYEGLEGIPKIRKPCLSESSGKYDYASSSLVGTTHDNDSHYLDLQLYELFRKADFELKGVDPHRNAVDAFLGQVAVSVENNQRLDSIFGIPETSRLWDKPDFVAFMRLMKLARHYCHILTEHAVNSISTFGIEPRFTSGACQGSKRNLTTGNSPIERFSNASVSKDVAPLLNAIADQAIKRKICNLGPFVAHHAAEGGRFIEPLKYYRFELPFWASFRNRAIIVDKVTKANFVPKTFITERATFSECIGDVAIQCGIGDRLRDSLAFNGYDVSTLPDLHKELARLGSISGHIATFDMKGGSENVFTSLSGYLMPTSLHELCIHARTHQVELDGKRISYPNMATAGNGFCFQLETIIFLSLQMAVCANGGLRPRVRKVSSSIGVTRKILKNGYHNLCSTFGDDVIIPTRFSPTFIEFFSKLGIVLNLEKSFYSGDFRESCGGHSLNGRDINCFNSKTVPTMGNTYEIKKFLNGIRLFGYDNNHNVWRHPALSDLWFGLLGTSFGKPDDRLESPKFVVNHGVNGDLGVLVPRIYRTTRYITRTSGPYTRTMFNRAAPTGVSIITSTNTVRQEVFRLYKIRSVNAAGGYPSVSQRFELTRYAKKISLPKLLRENPTPSLPLMKIVGQGCLSGAGIIHPMEGQFYDLNMVDTAIPRKGVDVPHYPEFFVRERLHVVRTSIETDPSASSHEEVHDLFNRIGDVFERTRLARITRESHKRKRLGVWENRRNLYHLKLISVLQRRASTVEDSLDQLFS